MGWGVMRNFRRMLPMVAIVLGMGLASCTRTVADQVVQIEDLVAVHDGVDRADRPKIAVSIVNPNDLKLSLKYKKATPCRAHYNYNAVIEEAVKIGLMSSFDIVEEGADVPHVLVEFEEIIASGQCGPGATVSWLVTCNHTVMFPVKLSVASTFRNWGPDTVYGSATARGEDYFDLCTPVDQLHRKAAKQSFGVLVQNLSKKIRDRLQEVIRSDV